MADHTSLAPVLAALLAALACNPAHAQKEDPTLLVPACEAGDAFACANLGVLHRHGVNVDKDYPEALTLFVQSCERGNDFACGAVGDMTYRGVGIPSNPHQGKALLIGACRRGNEWSCESARRLGLVSPKS